MARTKNIEQHKFSPDRGGDDDHRRGGEATVGRVHATQQRITKETNQRAEHQ